MFILEKDSGESKSIAKFKKKKKLKSIEINKWKKKKNEDINSCVYALIQLSGHSPKTVLLIGFIFLNFCKKTPDFPWNVINTSPGEVSNNKASH